MTESTFKTVLVLDTESNWYKPAAHNKSAADANDLVQHFSAEGRTSKIIDQEKRHRLSDPEKCKPCKEAALKCTDDTAAQAADAPAAAPQE